MIGDFHIRYRAAKESAGTLVAGAYFQHFKREILERQGQIPGLKYIYKIIMFASCAETDKDMVVYQEVETGKMYVRPLEEFVEHIDKSKYSTVQQIHRFEPVVRGNFTEFPAFLLRPVREASKISMGDLARVLNCSVVHISNIELGKELPNPMEADYLTMFINERLPELYQNQKDEHWDSAKLYASLTGRVERLEQTCVQMLHDLQEALPDEHMSYLVEKYGLYDIVCDDCEME